MTSSNYNTYLDIVDINSIISCLQLTDDGLGRNIFQLRFSA